MSRNTNPLSARSTLAKNVKKMRGELGLSQESLADLVGIHRTYIGSIERAERNISIDNIERIAKALNVSISILMMEHKNESPRSK